MNHRIAILSGYPRRYDSPGGSDCRCACSRRNGILAFGRYFATGAWKRGPFELLDAIPITAAVRGNWDDCLLEALDGEYGLEDPQEIQLLRLTQYLCGRTGS